MTSELGPRPLCSPDCDKTHTGHRYLDCPYYLWLEKKAELIRAQKDSAKTELELAEMDLARAVERCVRAQGEAGVLGDWALIAAETNFDEGGYLQGAYHRFFSPGARQPHVARGLFSEALADFPVGSVGDQG